MSNPGQPTAAAAKQSAPHTAAPQSSRGAAPVAPAAARESLHPPRPATSGSNSPATARKVASAPPKPEPPSFWSDEGYKIAVKRIEDGASCLDIMAKMVSERAALERKHAQGLRKWSKTWDDKLENAPSFKEGTLHNAWRGMLAEAESTATTMEELEKVLQKEVRETLLAWKKENYPTFLGRYKLAKKVTASFDKARKPLVKAKEEMTKKKAEYFRHANEVHETEHHREVAKQYQTPTSEADIKKLQAKLEKAVMDRDAAEHQYKEKHQAYLQALPAYQIAMKEAFQEVQDVEKKRIIFLRNVLEKYQALVTQSANTRMTEADAELRRKITSINPDTDLKLFADSIRVPDVPSTSEAKPEAWTPGASVKEDATNTPVLPAGSLRGAWFTKAAENFGFSHKRFFVLDKAQQQIHFFEKLEMGVPGGQKGTIELSKLKHIQAGQTNLNLIQENPDRVWKLSVTAKEHKQVEDWAHYISSITGIEITPIADETAVAAPIGALAGGAAAGGAAAAAGGGIQEEVPKKAPAPVAPTKDGKAPKKDDHHSEQGSDVPPGVVPGAAIGAGVAAGGAAAAAVKNHQDESRPIGATPAVGNVTHDSVTLSWTAPATSMASNVHQYQIYNAADMKTSMYTGQKLTHTVTGLAPDTEHVFVLRTIYTHGAALDVQIKTKTSAAPAGAAAPAAAAAAAAAGTTAPAAAAAAAAAGPADDKKVKAEEKKAEDKKAEEMKAEEKKAEEKKAQEKKKGGDQPAAAAAAAAAAPAASSTAKVTGASTQGYGPEHHEAAATIQAHFRGHKARKEVQKMKEDKALKEKQYTEEHAKAAVKIQSSFRGFKVRSALEQADLKSDSST